MREVLRTYDQIWTPSGPLSLPETIKHTVSGVSLMTHDFAELDNDLTISEDDSDAQGIFSQGISPHIDRMKMGTDLLPIRPALVILVRNRIAFFARRVDQD